MSDEEKWEMHLDEGDLVHFAPSSFNVCDPPAEFPEGSVTLYFQQLETLRDALNEFLPPRRAPVSDWTPVTEGLPEEDGEYLVTQLPGYEGAEISVEKWFFDKHGGGFGSDLAVAWRPLPPPWRGEGA